MADNPNAQLTFRSWLRRGLATQQKLLNDNDPRASVTIDVAISGIAKASVRNVGALWARRCEEPDCKFGDSHLAEGGRAQRRGELLSSDRIRSG